MDYLEKTNLVKTAMFYGLLITGNMTTILSAFILYVTAKMTGNNEDYRFLIAGLAVVNLFGGVLNGVLQPIFTMNGPQISVGLCNILAFMFQFPLLWGIYMNLLLALSRMLALYYPPLYKAHFTKKRSIVYTAGMGLATFFTVFLNSSYVNTHGFAYGWGTIEPVSQDTDTVYEFVHNFSQSNISYLYACTAISHEETSLAVLVFSGIVFSCTIASGVLMYTVYRKIRQQRAALASLSDEQKKRLNENRNVMMFVILQGITPFCMILVTMIPANLALVFNFDLYPTIAVVYVFFVSNILVDCCMTVMVVKPYRNAFVKAVKTSISKIGHTSNTIDSVIPLGTV